MAQGVGRHVAAQPSQLNGVSEALLDRGNGLSIPLDDRIADDAFAHPAPQMGQEARGEWHRRLPLLRFDRTILQAVEDALTQVDVRPASLSMDRRGCDGSRARPGVQAQQDEARDVMQRLAFCLDNLVATTAAMNSLSLSSAPARPEQARGFATG